MEQLYYGLSACTVDIFHSLKLAGITFTYRSVEPNIEPGLRPRSILASSGRYNIVSASNQTIITLLYIFVQPK